MIVAVNRRNTQRGTMASVLLDDKSGRIEATLFNETYERYRDQIVGDRVVVVEGSLVHDDYRGGLGIRADSLRDIETVRIERAAFVELRLSQQWCQNQGLQSREVADRLRQLLEPVLGGSCEIRIRYRRDDAELVMRMGEGWRVTPTDLLLKQTQRLLGPEGLGIRFSQGSPSQALHSRADRAHCAMIQGSKRKATQV